MFGLFIIFNQQLICTLLIHLELGKTYSPISIYKILNKGITRFFHMQLHF